ncbi:hypothetical protein [Paenibacillus gansuensis]|uniref:Holin n=1 Tax=Paenibacillus gansuensis TaxID=306542 RepID=A0ABW5P9X2_9BACL
MKRRWPWMALATAILFIGRAIPMKLESSAITNVFELMLAVSLMATIRRQDKYGESMRPHGPQHRRN